MAELLIMLLLVEVEEVAPAHCLLVLVVVEVLADIGLITHYQFLRDLIKLLLVMEEVVEPYHRGRVVMEVLHLFLVHQHFQL
jgi:hypothetical protein